MSIHQETVSLCQTADTFTNL